MRAVAHYKWHELHMARAQAAPAHAVEQRRLARTRLESCRAVFVRMADDSTVAALDAEIADLR